MDETALRALKDMQDVMPGDAGAVRIPQGTEDKLVRALILYLNHVLQKPLKSAELFLDAL